MASFRSDWALPIALVALTIVPSGAGIVRLVEIGGGAEMTPENARFFAGATSATIHIVTAMVFGIFGAFQFAARFRRRNPEWHRRVGRVVAAAGLTAGLSGLWMTLTYPFAPGDGALLYYIRLVVGVAMVVSVVLGYIAIRRRDVTRHRAWMTRGYAIGMGAGTQVLINLPWVLLVEAHPGETARALLLGAGWAINVVIAEWIIRAPPRRSAAAAGVTT